MEDINQLIRNVQSKLQWTIEMKRGNHDGLIIGSDFKLKKHTITYPLPEAPTYQLLMSDKALELQNLIQFMFAEQYSILFSAIQFSKQTEPELSKRYYIVFMTARDWFPANYVMALCPELKSQQIREYFHMGRDMLEQIEGISEDMNATVAIGSTIAMGEKYLKEKISTEGKLKDVIMAILNSPVEPTKENLRLFVNNILSVFSPYEADIVLEGNTEVWEVK